MTNLNPNPTPNPLTLSGSEALAYGALEAGVRFVTGYPGSPATDTVEAIQRLGGPHTLVRWAINEKSAADAALGVSLAGGRALLCVKAPGLNVALDTLMVANLAPGDGGFVILAGDDPGGWASQSEEDSRVLVQGLEIPMLEPVSAAAARAVMNAAFDLSEQHCLPVVVRVTRALTLDKADLPPLQPVEISSQPSQFKRQPDRWTVLPIHIVTLHQRLQEKMTQVQVQFEHSIHNNEEGDGHLGIIAAGYTAHKVRQVLAESGSPPLRLLSLATLAPLPEERLTAFLDGLDAVLVIEELLPYIETQIQSLAQRRKLTLPVYGRLSEHLPGAGELFEDALGAALARFLPDWPWPQFEIAQRSMPSRVSLCEGCPYIPAFEHLLAVIERNGGRDAYVITGETGCLVRAQLPPYQLLDIKYSMGSSIGLARGLKHAGVPQQAIALSGDSAFLHNGLGELIDAVQSGVDLLVVLLDNNKTAMTGGQPHPATRAAESQHKPVNLAALVRAAGVAQVVVIDPEDIAATQSAYEQGLKSSGVSVVIVEKPCPMYP
jgi:indolepyruvate ferredoxin oxidoreductase alpha subunit